MTNVIKKQYSEYRNLPEPFLRLYCQRHGFEANYELAPFSLL